MAVALTEWHVAVGRAGKTQMADALILQFSAVVVFSPMPAILKGWVDRVYAYGFALPRW